LASFHSSAQAQVLFKHKVIEGSTRTHEVSNLINQTLTIMGMEIKTEVDNSITLSTTTGKKDAQGRIPNKVKFEAVRTNITGANGVSLNFDSSINLSKTDTPQLEPVLAALKAIAGASYTVVLDAEYQLVELQGHNDIVKDAPEAAAPFLKAQFSEEKLKAAHQHLLARYPAKPVAVGDSWEHVEPVDLGSGQTMKMLRQYEYLGTEQRDGRTLDKLSAADKKVVSFEVDNTAPLKVSKTDLSVAESKATVLFDRDRGVEVEATRLMHIKGKLTLSINGNDLPTEVDLKIETTSRLK
jgi:hypothetical protein